MSATPPYACSPCSAEESFYDFGGSEVGSVKTETPSPGAASSKTAGRSRAPKGSTNIQKNPEQVKRRNARERRRVQAVNMAFLRLRDHIPGEGGKPAASKKVSKVDTLRGAAEYIQYLQQILTDSSPSPHCPSFGGSSAGLLPGLDMRPGPDIPFPSATFAALYPQEINAGPCVVNCGPKDYHDSKEALGAVQYSTAQTLSYFLPIPSGHQQGIGSHDSAYFSSYQETP